MRNLIKVLVERQHKRLLLFLWQALSLFVKLYSLGKTYYFSGVSGFCLPNLKITQPFNTLLLPAFEKLDEAISSSKKANGRK